MSISTSILSIKDNLKDSLKILDNSKTSFIHLDIMDGVFVSNENHYEDLSLFKDISKPFDVHLMVNDVYSYIDYYASLNPEYITFHYEAVSDPYLVIDYIKSYGIKAGVSIKPDTLISDLEPILGMVDLVLIMSVAPGSGGQKFIESSILKINELKKIRDKSYKFVIEVDGGINDDNIKEIDADIVVVGSFITSGNYDEQINKLL